MSAATGATGTAAGPGSWAVLDWRFLLPDPALGRVRLLTAGDAAADVERALRALGEDVVAAAPDRPGPSGDGPDAATPDGVVPPVDTVVGDGRTDLAAAVRLLRPGGLLALDVTGPPPGVGRAARLRPWAAWRTALGRHGLTVVAAAAAVPSPGRRSGYVAVEDTAALRTALRRHGRRPVSRLAGRVASWAVAVGLGGAVCPGGVVLARTAGTDAAGAGAADPGGGAVNLVRHWLATPAGRDALRAGGVGPDAAAGGCLVLTPRFPDSRHVVVLAHDARGRLAVVGKVVRAPGDVSTLDHEAAVLGALRHPAARSVPRLLALEWVGGHRMLVQSAVPGAAVTHHDARRGPQRWWSLVTGWLDGLVRTGAPARPDDWPQRYLAPGLEQARTVLADDADLLGVLDRTCGHLGVLARSALPDATEHGDLSHPNVLHGPDGTAVVDWENGLVDGVAGTDAAVFRTFLEFSVEKVHGTGPEVAVYREHVLADGSRGRRALEALLAGYGAGPELVDHVLLAAWARASLASFPRLASRQDPDSVARAVEHLRTARTTALWTATLDRLDRSAAR